MLAQWTLIFLSTWYIIFRIGYLRIPFHNVVQTMDCDVLDVLPAIHALTGSDTSSKVGTKKEALNIAVKEHGRIMSFGKEQYSEKMMLGAEKHLVSCLSKNKEEDFDALRFDKYSIHRHMLVHICNATVG